jgi:hypothetical protein
LWADWFIGLEGVGEVPVAVCCEALNGQQNIKKEAIVFVVAAKWIRNTYG